MNDELHHHTSANEETPENGAIDGISTSSAISRQQQQEEEEEPHGEEEKEDKGENKKDKGRREIEPPTSKVGKHDDSEKKRDVDSRGGNNDEEDMGPKEDDNDDDNVGEEDQNGKKNEIITPETNETKVSVRIDDEENLIPTGTIKASLKAVSPAARISKKKGKKSTSKGATAKSQASKIPTPSAHGESVGAEQKERKKIIELERQKRESEAEVVTVDMIDDALNLLDMDMGDDSDDASVQENSP